MRRRYLISIVYCRKKVRNIEVSSAEKLKKYKKAQKGKAILKGKNTFNRDGYMNMLNKYGTSQDNSESYIYTPDDPAMDLELIRLYEGNGLFTKIIDRPAEESIKHGFDIDYGSQEINEYVESKMDELNVEDAFATAEKWARLYGGSLVVMLVDDGRGLEEPLNWQDVRAVNELIVFERSIVQPDYTTLYDFNFENEIDQSRPFGQPLFYDVYSLYGHFRVHYTRCLVFRNGRLPEQTTNALYRYWGMPEYVKIKRALRETITSHADGVKLLERSVQAIYKMKNLANMLSSDDGEDKVIKRMQVIDMARGILNSLAIDADGEDYDFKTLPMSGIKDILDSTCNMLSAVTDIPQTILFGRSPAGENATGQSDMENYYNMIERIQKMNMKSNSRILIDLILLEGKFKGKIKEIPNYKVKFAALWSMSETEQATVDQMKAQTELTKAQTADAYITMQVLDPSEVRKSLSEQEGYDLDYPEDGEEWNLPNVLAEDDEIQEINSDEKDVTAAAVIVVKDGRILAGQRAGDEGLCGPGGKIEQGETPEEAAKREVFEEFGIDTLDIIPLGVNKATNAQYRDTKIYLCTTFGSEPRADGEEMYTADWYSLDELNNTDLFQPFKESLEILMNVLKGVVPDG